MFCELLEELLAALFRVALEAEVHGHHECVIHTKTHVHVGGVLEAADKKSGASEKQE